nr:caspase family protein [Spirosoma oryzae]
MTDLLTEFDERIKGYDASIFYFAGHGFEVKGENYLAFTECQIDSLNEYHCRQTCIQLTDLLKIYKKNPDKVNIAIIDACRKSFERGGIIANSPIQAPRGSLIAFSTSPNEGASDVGFEGHSIFTGALLNYVGREHLSVEELFKKVRKTVYNVSGGKQTSWEHTSLIGDFYFNTGQLTHSQMIPYSEEVVKDAKYSKNDDFGCLIAKIKSYDWNIQNPAILEVLRIKLSKLDKNQQFVLGRNILQASGAANEAKIFMNSLPSSLRKYQIDGENHVLNGILFEIYFDSRGEFRKSNTKKYFIDKILNLRKDETFYKSFSFLSNLLHTVDYNLIYIPGSIDEIIDIDVIANVETVTSASGKEIEYQVISRLTFNSVDILNDIYKYNVRGKDDLYLKEILGNFLTAPAELIHIHSNIGLKKIMISKDLEDDF